MSKESEALSRLYYTVRVLQSEINQKEQLLGSNTTFDVLEQTDKDVKILKEALLRLEAIDNANTSEALKLAELLECDLQATNDLVTRTINGYDYLDILETIKQALLKAQEPKHYVDELKLVEKKLKALEIIKEKECDVSWLKYCIKENLIVEAYNSGYPEYHKKLTEEEFNLLKEVLE